jgi:hypothetical protein
MAAQYPAQIPSFTGEVGGAGSPLDNPSLPVWAQHASDEIVAVASELGVDVSGGFATVAGRLAAQSQIAPFDRGGALTVSGGVRRLRFPVKATILGVQAAVNTAPTGAALIVDVNIDGTTAFTTQTDRPQIAAGAFDSGAEKVPAVTAIPAGSYLTVDVDQIGATVAGSDLTVVVRWVPSA